MTLRLCPLKVECLHSPAVCQVCNPDTWAPPRRHGCNNRPPLVTVRVMQDGHEPQTNRLHPRVERMAMFHVPNTTDCQYTSSEAGRVDPGCTGCRWRAP